MKKLILYGQKIPCTGCLIAQNLMREVITKTAAYDWHAAGISCGVETEIILLKSPREADFIDEIEIPTFPALVFDGVQISAGNIVPMKALAKIISRVFGA